MESTVEKVQKETVPAAEDSEDANTSDETNANHNSEEPEKDSIAIQIETANPIITEEKETCDGTKTTAKSNFKKPQSENALKIRPRCEPSLSQTRAKTPRRSNRHRNAKCTLGM